MKALIDSNIMLDILLKRVSHRRTYTVRFRVGFSQVFRQHSQPTDPLELTLDAATTAPTT